MEMVQYLGLSWRKPSWENVPVNFQWECPAGGLRGNVQEQLSGECSRIFREGCLENVRGNILSCLIIHDNPET